MTLPLSGSQWTDGEELVAALMYARIDQQLMQLWNSVAFGRIGVAQSNVISVTLSSLTTQFYGGIAVTFTLTSTRMVRLDGNVTFQMASGTAGTYAAQAYWNSGSSATIGSGTTIGYNLYCGTTVTGGNGRASTDVVASLSFSPGTYTMYLGVSRTQGGSATDTTQNSRLEVTDEGPG